MLMEKLLLLIVFFRLPSELDSWMISNACTDGKCNIHHLTCNGGRHIRIDSAYYGFTRYNIACTRHCSGKTVHSPQICAKPFSKEDYDRLKKKCNGKQMCYVTTPGQSNKISCNKKIHVHTVSSLYYSCIEATRQETREPSGFTVPIFIINKMTLTMVTIPIDDLMTTESTAKKASLTTMLDIPVTVGSVTGCLILVILLVIIILVVIKRRNVISKQIQGSSVVENPGYEITDEKYNHGILSTDNSPSTRSIESDDYNHLHDTRNNNSTDNADDYNHLGILTGENYQFNDDYNHLGGVKEEKINYDCYSHIGAVKGKKDKFNHIGEVKGETIDDDYSHIGVENYPSHGQNEDHYNHLADVHMQVSIGDISTEIINKDDNNYPDETNYANYINIYENI